MIGDLPLGVQGVLQKAADFLFLRLQGKGNHHVEHQIDVPFALDHPEIMEGQPGIPALEQAEHPLAKPVQLRVVHHHRVIVNHQVHVVAAQALPLHIVDDLMAFQRILPVVHFHMDAGKPLARAVVVNHQVMVAQHLGLGDDVIHQLPPKLRIRVLTKQRRNGILGQTPAAVQDKGRHCQAHPAVHGDVELSFKQGGQEYRGGGDAVVPAVLGGGKQRLGVDFLRQSPIEQVHPQLHADGGQQHHRRNGRKFHRRGMEDFFGGGLDQLHADDQDQHRHSQTTQIFRPGVTVGVSGIRRLIRHPETDEGHDGAGGIGQVVHGIGGNGHGTGQGSHQQLEAKQQQVAGDPHHAGQGAHRRTHLRVIRVLPIFYKQPKQQFRHIFLPNGLYSPLYCQ